MKIFLENVFEGFIRIQVDIEVFILVIFIDFFSYEVGVLIEVKKVKYGCGWQYYVKWVKVD